MSNPCSAFPLIFFHEGEFKYCVGLDRNISLFRIELRALTDALSTNASTAFIDSNPPLVPLIGSYPIILRFLGSDGSMIGFNFDCTLPPTISGINFASASESSPEIFRPNFLRKAPAPT